MLNQFEKFSQLYFFLDFSAVRSKVHNLPAEDEDGWGTKLPLG
jgi:hypothetical protein